jgi:hypothetical protein
MLAKLVAIVEHDDELVSWLEHALQPSAAKAFRDARAALEYERAAEKGISAPELHNELVQHNRTGMKKDWPVGSWERSKTEMIRLHGGVPSRATVYRRMENRLIRGRSGETTFSTEAEDEFA